MPTERPVGVAVTSLMADAASSTALHLSWQLLTYGGGLQRPLGTAEQQQQQRPLPVDGFRIRYRKTDDAEYQTKIVRTGDINDFVLTGLRTWQIGSMFLNSDQTEINFRLVMTARHCVQIPENFCTFDP